MIKYSEGEPLDLLSPPLASDNDVIAISYAIKNATAKLIAYAAKTRLYADVGNLPEELLDILALELQTVYYDESLDIETKRELIKNSLLWHIRAGTTGAVKELVATVFGAASVSEWYDYGGAAYYFKVSTASTSADEDLLDQLEKIIENAKNARSWLEGVSFESGYELDLPVSFGAIELEELTDVAETETEIAILSIDGEAVITTDAIAADADGDGLYDTVAADEEISAAYEGGKLILSMPSGMAWETVG